MKYYARIANERNSEILYNNLHIVGVHRISLQYKYSRPHSKRNHTSNCFYTLPSINAIITSRIYINSCKLQKRYKS